MERSQAIYVFPAVEYFPGFKWLSFIDVWLFVRRRKQLVDSDIQ